jgi:pimeloyl-ACP methyl ester carboxylesterase
VILLANRGVGASTGVVPDNVSDMARDVQRFVDALPLREIDLPRFSLGGYIGQELAPFPPTADPQACAHGFLALTAEARTELERGAASSSTPPGRHVPGRAIR